MSQAKSLRHEALVRYRAAEQALRLIYEQIQEAERATERSRKVPRRRDPEE
ncbi:hypothetical protein [Microvirga massiliensis]|uniref:hypothetical protein n=1 Tax=Microvirga massiliensis TaxID=1033741 RepID=UPI000AB77731|nr:hypothetical protein [Microvirga massiliensis]